jgi:hydantoinase/carbamoylase family amidase
MLEARSRIDAAADSYVELHIEQGPVLEATSRATAAVSGCLGVRRTRARFMGQAAHAGATPMGMRRDPTVAASGLLLGARELALAAGGLITVGAMNALPGTPTAVASSVEMIIDLRHPGRDALERLDAEVADLARQEAAAAGCDLSLELLWSIDPVPFDGRMVAHATAITGGEPLSSGALHDAAAMAMAGVPCAMLFVRTRGGISHSREEDASEDDLAAALEQFAHLVSDLVLAD